MINSKTVIVLQDDLETKKRGKPVYFGGMTKIGPKYTEEILDAVKFDNKMDALRSPAYIHPLCFFEPKEFNL